MKPKGSHIDSRGIMFVDCAECTRGGNGSNPDKCSCGGTYKRVGRGGCFAGRILPCFSKPEADPPEKGRPVSEVTSQYDNYERDGHPWG